MRCRRKQTERICNSKRWVADMDVLIGDSVTGNGTPYEYLFFVSLNFCRCKLSAQ